MRPESGLESASAGPKLFIATFYLVPAMPIYAFRCAECGHEFDRLQKMSDPDPDTCPNCGAHAVGRQITAPSFRLSGNGWYETDFKKGGDKKRNLAEGGEGASKGSSSPPAATKTDAAPKADSKPAAKPAADSA